MKLLDFVCNKCNTVFEELVKEGTEIKCPKCNSKDVKRILSGFSTLGSKKNHTGSSCSTSKGFS